MVNIIFGLILPLSYEYVKGVVLGLNFLPVWANMQI